MVGEFIGSVLSGGLLGGLLRLAPEVLKFFNGRSERAHELEMARLSMQRDQAAHGGRMAEIAAAGQFALDKAGVDALIAGIRAQAEPSGVRWIDGLGKSVRPVVTYWLLLVFTLVKAGQVAGLMQVGGVGLLDALGQCWGATENEMLWSILTFWFLDRSILKRARG